MEILISNGETSLNTANGFYRVEAANLGCFNTTSLTLTTTRYIDVTFANAGDCQGIVLWLLTVSMSSRQITVNLQEDSGGWTTRATKTLETADIAGSLTSGVYINRGQYITPFIFDTPYTITTAASTWRFEIAHGTGSGTWQLRTSNGTNPSYATWCNNQLSFSDDDILICKDKVTVDKTTSFGGVLGTGDAANGVGCVLCSNILGAADEETVANLVWQSPPTSAYNLTTKGLIYGGSYSGIRIGYENRTLSGATITIANPGVVSYTAHGLTNGQIVKFTTTGALPTGITAGTSYYVVNKTDNTFEIEATIGGGSIETTGTQSGTHTCTHVRRIPIAQKATLTFGTAVVGTYAPRIVPMGYGTGQTSASYVYGGLMSLFLYGEIPTYQKTHLAADAAIGQADLVCTDNVDWVTGDKVVIGKQYSKGQGVTTIHEILSVLGNTITLTSNLATNIRKGPTDGDTVGGTVLKLDSHGILFTSVPTMTHYIWCPQYLKCTGTDFFNTIINTAGGTSYYYYRAALGAAYRDQTLFQDVTAYTDGTTMYLLTDLINNDGTLMERVYTFRTTPAYTCVWYSASGHKSLRLTIKDCIMLSVYGVASISTSTNIRYTFEGNRIENTRSSSTSSVNLTGINTELIDNYFYGGGVSEANYGSMSVRQCINPNEISGNVYEYCACAIVFMNFASIKCIDESSKFYENTVDIGFFPESLPDYVFKNLTGSLTISETYIPDILTGGKVGFHNYNVTTNDCRNIYYSGNIVSTGVSLSDATAHTAGGLAMRFEPTLSNDSFEYSFDVPTGDITGLTMSVAIWCKINAAAYYASDYDMPRLTVTYDGKTDIYSDATATTDWQLLSVSFAPTTSAGKITVKLSGRTDATSTDRYFYWDDMSILYPAGYKLDLGGMDIWDSGLPVIPPIATVISAKDIWSIDPTSFATGTVGDKVNAIHLKAGLIPALL